eukprot:TRINITY_DN7935_c1_g1_i1.p1 TRINITY_DN7935_c1_g1~~TRINITY_DN7935_c1_g1_i1.p1  ORF type:complete len:253 (-),score=42.25 TRINITY_DN7935_c1_g1_i1:421-1179(-)
MAPCAEKRAVLCFLGFMLHAADTYRFEGDDLMDDADVVNVSSAPRTSCESLLELNQPMTQKDFEQLPDLNDHYTKDEKFGDYVQGGVGEVYKAHDSANEETVVVVKEIKRTDYVSAEHDVMSLNLPFIAEVISKGGHSLYKSNDDKVALVMTKYETDVSTFRNKNRQFVDSKWKQWGKQMAYGLWQLHRRKILYADVKPENTFIVDDVDEFVEDIVLGQDCGPTACATSKRGSPSYMSPNILEGQPYGYEVD